MKLMYSCYVVRGVRTDKDGCTQPVVANQRPHYYTMYGVDRDGHEIAVADFKRCKDALALERELNRLISVAVEAEKLLRIVNL